MKIRNYLLLLRANYRCYLCHRKQPVVALGTSDLYDEKYGWLPTSEEKPLFILSEVHSTAPEIVDLVRCMGVIYEQRKNSTGGDTCFANWCIDCGARFGDFYLTGQPGGPFFPETIDAAGKIDLLEIPLASELEFACAYSRGGPYLNPPHVREFRDLRRSRPSPYDDSQW